MTQDMQRFQSALEAGDAEKFASLCASERTHDVFLKVRPDLAVPAQRAAFLCAAKAVLPAHFMRDLRLARCRLPLDVSAFWPGETATLFLDLFECALEHSDEEMLARLHAMEPRTSKIIGGGLDQLGHRLVTNERYQEAIDTYDLALKFTSPGRSVYANALWVAQKDNTGLPIDRDRNARWLATSIPEGRENPAIFVNAAGVYMEQGDFDEVETQIRAALSYGNGFDRTRDLVADPMFDDIRDRVDAIFTNAPEGVHPEAWWSSSDDEWVFGDKDAQGRFQGLVKYWRPGGTLACATEHVDGDPDGTFTRYHESGDISRKGHLLGSVLYGLDVTHRPLAWSSEAKEMWCKTPESIHVVETHWIDRQSPGEPGRFTHQVFRDAEGCERTPAGVLIPRRPEHVDAAAVFLKDVWGHGSYDSESDKVGPWDYHDPEGAFLRSEHYDDEGILLHSTRPSTRSDVAFERGQGQREWQGIVTLLDEQKAEIGSFDASGADQVRDPALAAWVNEVRAVDWAGLECAYGSATPTAHYLLTFAVTKEIGDEDTAADRYQNALSSLYSHICHQGSTYTASRAAMPLLVRLACMADAVTACDAIELCRDMSLAMRRHYEQWRADGAETPDTTAISECAASLIALHKGTSDKALRVATVQCLAGCFESPLARQFLREQADTGPKDERATTIAALGNLVAITKDELKQLDEEPPLVQVAFVYACALSGDPAVQVPDALARILSVLAGREPGVDDAASEAFDAFDAQFQTFPLADSILDDLAFMVQADGESIDSITSLMLGRLENVAGLGATSTLACALELILSDADFDLPRSQLFRAIADKDDLWLDSKGNAIRLVNVMEVLAVWNLPTDRDEFIEHCREHDEEMK